MFSQTIRTIAVVAAVSLVSLAAAGEEPLKVYILAGQSNMQGQSRVSGIPRMALSPDSKALHDKIVDADGTPRIHKNVYIAAFSQKGGYGVAFVDKEKHGQLTVGYGNNTTSDSAFGPELGFGITMGELVKEPILIIKTAWGGKSLNTDFRPPSAGLKTVDEKTIEKWKEAGTYDEQMAKLKGKSGHYYRLMMKHVKTVLADPGKYCAAYDPKAGYEIAGFAWFQGYNDRFAGPPFDFYTKLMAHFIRDVRKELNAPKMPFVIGVIGINGHNEKKESELALRKAMAAPAEMPEFKGNVMAVQTADYWDDELEQAVQKARQYQAVYGASYVWTKDGRLDRSHVTTPGWQPVGTPAFEEREWRYLSFERDPEDHYRPLRPGEKGDERAFKEETPEALKGWNQPGFDDSGWKKGPAPIGKGKIGPMKNRSDWGEGNILLMRTTFELDTTDYEAVRLSILASSSYHVYLNGHKVYTWVWWKRGGNYRTFVLSEEHAKYLKKGKNVLAAYTNVTYRKSRPNPCTIDLLIEGLTKEGMANLKKVCGEICTPRDLELSKGRCHQGFHYLGSAKTLSQVGEALANAIAKKSKKGE